MAHLEQYRPHDFRREDTPNPRRHVPPIPDLRFEYSYLRSVRPLVHVERVAPVSGVDEKGKGVVSKQATTPQERITVEWIRLVWITTRDQVLSPFLQGALWGIAAIYVKPLLASLGTSFKAWWARGAVPRRRVEGEGANWLRTRISTVTTPSVAPVSPRML